MNESTILTPIQTKAPRGYKKPKIKCRMIMKIPLSGCPNRIWANPGNTMFARI
jgi:hypothetical protein